MKMDVDEFRSRLREVTEHERPVVIVEQNRVLGHYLPVSGRDPTKIDIKGWADACDAMRERWIARTPDWIERLERFGLDEKGDPFENEPRP